MKTSPIHPSDLIKTLKDDYNYNYFVDELHRIVPIDYFEILFVYKYANQLSGFTFKIDLDNYKLHCENISGMEFVFPLKKTISYII